MDDSEKMGVIEIINVIERHGVQRIFISNLCVLNVRKLML